MAKILHLANYIEQHYPEIRVNTDFLFQELLRTKAVKTAAESNNDAARDMCAFLGGFDVSMEFLQFMTDVKDQPDRLKRVWAWPHANAPLPWRTLDIKDVVPVPQIQYLMNEAHPHTRIRLIDGHLCLHMSGLRHAIWSLLQFDLPELLDSPTLCENTGPEYMVLVRSDTITNCEPDRLRLFIESANDDWRAYGTWMPTVIQHTLSLTSARRSVCVILSFESPFLVHLLQHFDQQFGTTVASVLGTGLHVKLANVLRVD